MQPRDLIVIGPSGSGKSTIFATLRREGAIDVIPTWTTRAPRRSEHTDNIDHVFCSEAEFNQRVSENFFMETVQPFGLPARYGLPHVSLRQHTERIPVLMARVSVMGLVQLHLSNYVVYQVEAPHERVRVHLQQRALQGGALGSRLDDFSQELALGRHYAHRIVDNAQSLSDTLKAVKRYLVEDFASTRALHSRASDGSASTRAQPG